MTEKLRVDKPVFETLDGAVIESTDSVISTTRRNYRSYTRYQVYVCAHI